MLPASKLAAMIVPQTVTNAGTLTGLLDTKGFDFVSIDLLSESQAATNVPTVMRIGESDTAPTAFADCTVITNFVGGTATSTSVGFVIPTPVTLTSAGVNTYSVKFNIDLRGRKRYLAIEFSPITTHTLSVNANLHRGDEMPDSAADANVQALVAA